MSLKILLLDDEELALKNLNYAVSLALPEAETVQTTSPQEALKIMEEDPADVVMADIEMPGMDGIEFARRLSEIRRETNVIFVTAYSEYALDAFREHASGFLMKPVRAEAIRREFEHLRYPVERAEKKEEKLKLVCFGRFEVYRGNDRVRFSRSAEKEILAYLVDLHGGGANTNELCGILWEDSEERSKRRDYFRVLYNGLKKSLEKYGFDEVLIKQQNYFAVDISKIDCDYYRFLDGDPEAVRQFHGEYMSQYSWANLTTGSLEEQKQRMTGELSGK